MKIKPYLPPQELVTLQFEPSGDVERLTSELYSKLTPHFGITLQGPYLTLRWRDKGGELTQCHMLIQSMTNSGICEEPEEDK